MKYFFLGASLPMLSLETPPPMTLAQFTALCGGHLLSEHMAVFERLMNDATGPDDGEFALAWRDRDAELRNAVVAERAARLGVDAGSYERDSGASCDTYVCKGVAEAFAGKNPRQRELALDRLRWGVIEELQGFDSFSPEAIYGYGLKLRLAERWAGLSEKKGRERMEEMVGRLTTVAGVPATAVA